MLFYNVCVYIYIYIRIVYIQTETNELEKREDYLKNINMNQNVFYILFQHMCDIIIWHYAQHHSNIYWHIEKCKKTFLLTSQVNILLSILLFKQIFTNHRPLALKLKCSSSSTTKKTANYYYNYGWLLAIRSNIYNII